MAAVALVVVVSLATLAFAAIDIVSLLTRRDCP
jgi:hypothetical protein